METPEGELLIIVYVDDLIVATNNTKLYENIKENLAEEFRMKDMGKLHCCLGIEFNQDQRTNKIVMCQKKYVQDILDKYDMNDAKPASTPLDNSLKLTREMCPKTELEQEEMKNVPYRSLIGSLMYLAVCTRPDIAFAISYLSQFNNNPGKTHWKAAKHVLRYLKGTVNNGLTFQKTGKPLTAFVDADWGSDLNDRKSYTGYVFKFAGGAITWESRKQRTVALSSTEAEYMALSDVSKETVHLRRFFSELIPIDTEMKPTIIYCDNQGAQKIMRNPVHHSRTKHIDIRHHFIREVFERGELDVVYIATSEMAADVLTKALGSTSHKTCCDSIGIRKIC